MIAARSSTRFSFGCFVAAIILIDVVVIAIDVIIRHCHWCSCALQMANEHAMQQKDMETLLEGISSAEDAERVAKEEVLAAAKRYEAQLEAADRRFVVVRLVAAACCRCCGAAASFVSVVVVLLMLSLSSSLRLVVSVCVCLL